MAALLARRWTLAMIWALSIVATAAMAAAAQRLTISPTLVSGNDVGFRIERTQDGFPVGRLVVRVDGRWVDALPSPTNSPR
jgi:hypothetical protein